MAVACLAGALASLAPPVAAQTGYPPGPCSILSGSQFAGNVAVGQSFTIRVAPTCLYTPGGTASVVVNGSAAFSKPVNSDGTVTVSVTVLSTTQLSVNPIVPAVCGINTISVTAPSSVAGGQPVTQTVTFNVVCPGQPDIDINICNAGDGGSGGAALGAGGTAAAAGGSGTGTGGTSTAGAGTGTGGGGGAGGDACTITIGGGGSAPSSSGGGGGGGGAGGAGGAGGGGGAGGAGGGPGTPGAPGTPGVSGQSFTVSQGFLSRTGSDVARYGAIALALVMVGGVLTVTGRRRRTAGRLGG